MASGGSACGVEVEHRVALGRDEAAARVAPRGDDQPRQLVELGGERAQEVRRRRVHLVGVLDLDQRRIRQPGAQEAQRRPRAGGRGGSSGASSATSGVGGRSAPSGIASSGSHGSSSGSRSRTAARRRSPTIAVGVLPRGADERAQQVAPGDVGRGGGVGLAGDAQARHAAGARPQLLGEAGLADAGLARDLDEPARPPRARGERVLERGELRVAADEREAHGDALAGAAAERRADRPGLDRLALALDRERRHRLDVEARGGALEHARRSRTPRRAARGPSAARRGSPRRP